MQRYRNVAIRATHGGCVLRKAVMSRAFYKLTYHLNYRLGTIYIHGELLCSSVVCRTWAYTRTQGELRRMYCRSRTNVKWSI